MRCDQYRKIIKICTSFCSIKHNKFFVEFRKVKVLVFPSDPLFNSVHLQNISSKYVRNTIIGAFNLSVSTIYNTRIAL